MNQKGSITDAVLLTVFFTVFATAFFYMLHEGGIFLKLPKQKNDIFPAPSTEKKEEMLPDDRQEPPVNSIPTPSLTAKNLDNNSDNSSGQGTAGLLASPPLSSPYKIQYYPKNSENIKYLSIEINGVPVEAIFDTGASFVSVGNDVIQSLGVKSFHKIEKASTPAGAAISYSFICNSIKVGGIEAKNIKCVYIPAMQGALLGGSFISLFNYSVDENNSIITFAPR